jgi:isopentenyl phosphate kinase
VNELVLLKLGGSLITDKTKPYTPRTERLGDLAAQIARAIETHPDLRLVLGHGSGSFGHTAAEIFGTRDGVSGAESWRGFAEVWFQASALNRFVMDSLRASGIPAVALAPVASVIAREGYVVSWDLAPLKAALGAKLLPVVYGDVIFDTARGGTILSTEDLFVYLARHLHPKRILLAGLEAGVWQDFPDRTRRVEWITPDTYGTISAGLGRAAGADVTGGMEAKVRVMLELVQQVPGLRVQVFSGEAAGNLERVLTGEVVGTIISA